MAAAPGEGAPGQGSGLSQGKGTGVRLLAWGPGRGGLWEAALAAWSLMVAAVTSAHSVIHLISSCTSWHLVCTQGGWAAAAQWGRCSAKSTGVVSTERSVPRRDSQTSPEGEYSGPGGAGRVWAGDTPPPSWFQQNHTGTPSFLAHGGSF